MKANRLKSALAATLLLAAAGASPLAHAVPVVQFDSASVNVEVGASFVLVLQGTGFDTTAGGLTINNVSGGQRLNLSFSAAALAISSISIDPRWSFAAANRPGLVDNAAGTLTGMAFGVFPAATDTAFNIARITFTALQALPADVVVTAVDFAGRVNNVAGSNIVASFVPTSVQIAAVPEPQGWAMLAAGIGWLALRRRNVLSER